MKFLGRLIYGLAVLMIGYTVYGFSAIDMQAKHVVKYGDEAIEAGEYEYFQKISEFYYGDAFEQKKITTSVGSFNLGFYVVNYQEQNVVMVIIDHLEGYVEKNRLRLEVTVKNLVDAEKEESTLELLIDNNLSKNWYLTTVDTKKVYEGQLEIQDIVDLKIYLIGEEPKKATGEEVQEERVDLLMYDHDETTGVFMTADYMNLYAKRTDADGKTLDAVTLEGLGIYASKGHSYAEFQSILWRNIIIYIIIVVAITYLLFFRGKDKFGKKKFRSFGSKKAPAAKDTKVIDAQGTIENFNSKALFTDDKDEPENKK